MRHYFRPPHGHVRSSRFSPIAGRQIYGRLVFVVLLLLGSRALCAEPFQDRFVWVFGWNLNRDSDTAEISRVLDTATEHGLNGAVMSLGLDTLCKKKPEYFQRLEVSPARLASAIGWS